MTVVSAMDIGGFPILIGDALLSAQAADELCPHEPVPTIDNLSRIAFSRKDLRIAGLENKLAVINRRNLAVGWTGIRDVASNVLNYLVSHLSSSPNLAEIRDALQRVRGLISNPRVILVGCVMIDGQPSIFKWQGINGAFEIGPIFTEGSGAKTVRTQYERRVLLTPDVQHPLLFAVETVGLLLSHEIIEGANLPEFFGGGFDILYYYEEAFRRPQSAAHIFFKVEFGLNGFDLKLFPTSFWQSFDDKWSVERIDFALDRLEIDKTMRTEILGKSSGKIELIVPEEPTPDLLNGDPANFISVTTSFWLDGYELLEVGHPFWVPHHSISVSKSDAEIELYLAPSFLEKLENQIRVNFANPQMRENIKSFLALRPDLKIDHTVLDRIMEDALSSSN